MKKKIIPLIATVLLGSIALYAYRNGRLEPKGRILLHGNIEVTEIDIAFKTAGKLIERMVNEGDDIERGQIVARLDREQLLRQRQQAVAALELAKAQFEQAVTAAHYHREAVAADVAARKAELRGSQARLRELQT